ncbi:MAG: hypothetical protein Pg6C_00340 [Treponemataceae bacterium]|nr:MAG: hypothetical protein Pg6C_00340 [Treponemataceae bacterium]
MKTSLVLMSALAAFLVSCATTAVNTPVFDGRITAENGATVYFGKGVNVLSVNGIDVNEAWYGKTYWSDESARVILPAGKTAIVFDLYFVEGVKNNSKTFSAKSMELHLNFEAGKEYTVAFVPAAGSNLGILATGQRGIGIYDKLPDMFGGLSDSSRIDFIPMEFQ